MKYLLPTAAMLACITHSAWSAETGCSTTIEGSDAMQYNSNAIEIPKSCKQFTVTLKHTGKLPKSAMGHNWVASRAADQQAIINDGIAAGLANDYLKTGDTRVIAHTKVVGGGESASTTFPVATLKAAEPYVFFCSFPGHAAIMKGTLTVK